MLSSATPVLSVEEQQRALLALLKSLQETRRGVVTEKWDPFVLLRFLG
jgi:hypothetical protein